MLFFNTAIAQKTAKPDFNITPDGVLENVFDQNGTQYSLLDLLINSQVNTNTVSNLITCSSTSYFNLYFEPGCGMEDISNPTHNERRAVVCKVFEDLSNFINSPLTTPGNTTKVNIWVRNINNVYTNPNGRLGTATGFYNLPSSTVIGGIADNEIWKTIHTGVDSYLNVTTPLTSLGGGTNQAGFFYHGMVTFNFNDTATPPIPNTNPINWNTSLTATTIPTTTFDLYSAVLHEVTHALGFNSLIDQNGNSKFGPNFKYYNRYDTFLKTNNLSQFLLTSTASTPCSAMYDNGFNSSLNASVLHPNPSACASNSLCSDAIKFAGTTPVPVYTPNCFSDISSLSHFEDTHFPVCNTTNPIYGNDNYFLMCNAGNSGTMRRYLKPEERQALCDIGYSVKTTFGSSGVRITPTTFGPYNYGGTACGGITVAGVNDGINTDGEYTFLGTVSADISINGNTILFNDRNASGFECLQDLTANATFPTAFNFTSGTTATNITFNSALAGLHLLRYVPTNDTQKGNITYIYIFVQPIVTNPICNATPTTCNLVGNGNFEQNNSYLSVTANWEFNRLCGWFRVGQQYTEYMHANTVDPNLNVPCNRYGSENDKIANNQGYVAIKITDYAPAIWKFSSIIGTTLPTDLQPITTYQLSFDVSTSEFLMYRYARLQAFISSTLPANITGSLIPTGLLNTGILLTSPTFSNTTNGWETITFTFTTGTNVTNLRNLYIGGLNNFQTLPGLNPTTASGCVSNYSTNLPISTTYYIDNVSLIATGGATLNLPASICVNQTLPNLTNYLAAVPTNGQFLVGNGVVLNGGIYSFSNVVAGTYTITYTYNNNLGCPITLSDTIVVTTTSTTTGTIDAIDDNFTSMPINGSGGVSAMSVLNNDLLNNVPPSTNFSLSLIAPIPISGATINSSGLLSLPATNAGIAEGTYVFTYRVDILGACSSFDTATITVYVSDFIPTLNLSSSIRANAVVNIIELQSTNKILIAGAFKTYNNLTRYNFTRLNTDLTLDTTFPVFSTYFSPYDVAIQLNDDIICVGWSSDFATSTSFGIKKLKANGVIDTSFNSGGVGTAKHTNKTNNMPMACAVQSLDQKILLGGDFYYYNGVPSNGIARLNSDGSIDSSFDPIELNTYFRSVVTNILVQPDGNILLEGFFSPPIVGSPQMNILRLLPDGQIDITFTMGNIVGSVPYQNISVSIFGPLTKMALQPDGNIVVVGAFQKYNGASANSIVRLDTNGNPDQTFNTGADRAINDVLIEPGSNKIIIAGEFSFFNNVAVKKMIRLTTTGDIDGSFTIGSGTLDYTGTGLGHNFIKVLTKQPDGKIIVGGKFTSFNGLTAGNITRIYGDVGVQAKSNVLEYISEPEINTNFESNVMLYPNPSKDVFTIDLTQEIVEYNSVSIYNLLGKKVYSSTINPKEINTINLSDLADGYYLARLENQANSKVLKLIKN